VIGRPAGSCSLHARQRSPASGVMVPSFFVVGTDPAVRPDRLEPALARSGRGDTPASTGRAAAKGGGDAAGAGTADSPADRSKGGGALGVASKL